MTRTTSRWPIIRPSKPKTLSTGRKGTVPKATVLCDFCGRSKPAVGNALMVTGRPGSPEKMACSDCRKANLEAGTAWLAPDN
jgi:hypothetical protein